MITSTDLAQNSRRHRNSSFPLHKTRLLLKISISSLRANTVSKQTISVEVLDIVGWSFLSLWHEDSELCIITHNHVLHRRVFKSGQDSFHSLETIRILEVLSSNIFMSVLTLLLILESFGVTLKSERKQYTPWVNFTGEIHSPQRKRYTVQPAYIGCSYTRNVCI